MRGQREREQRRYEFLYGYAGRQAFDQESATVFDALRADAGAIDATFEASGHCAYVVRERGIYATVAMTSDGRDRQLLVQVWDGAFWGVGMQPVGTVTRRVCLTFELELPDRLGWHDGNRFYTSNEAADSILGWVLDAAQEDERRERERLRQR